MEKIDYTVGDTIVRVGNGNYTKDGEVFEALEICKSPCGCEIFVDIGRETPCEHIHCGICGKLIKTKSSHFYAPNFKKLDTLVDISELTEVLENTNAFEL